MSSSSHSVVSAENELEDECYHELPFDFIIQDDDLEQNQVENNVDVGVDVDENDGIDLKDLPTSSWPTEDGELASSFQLNCNASNITAGIDQHSNSGDPYRDLSVVNQNSYSEPSCPPPVNCWSTTQRQPTSPPLFTTITTCADISNSIFIPHKSSLKRIITPHNDNYEASADHNKHDPLASPIYSITVNLEATNRNHDTPTSHLQATTRDTTAASSILTQQQYQILFSRAQYEQCSKLFTLLDIESASSIGPECVKDFVWRHCPVIRRRDAALFALSVSDVADGGHSGEDEEERQGRYSPTFDEIWNVVVQSDPRYRTQQQQQQDSTILAPRLGIEGWIVFTRLLSLVSHYESQRRFASRHLQQMMRHKHNNGSSPRVNANEVVVVVDNPPAGPPVAVTVSGLMEVEREIGKEDGSCILVEGWPYGTLPFIELDLDHVWIAKFHDTMRRDGVMKTRKVMIQPFSHSLEGDFILRYSSCVSPVGLEANKPIVVRRSYSDFYWLNDMLRIQKRPGHGHLCGRILPPFPQRHGSSMTSRSGSGQYRTHRPKDVSERAVAVAKSSVGMITSVAKSLWGNYIAPTATLGMTPSSPTKKKRENKAKSSSSSGAYNSWPGVPLRKEDMPSDVAEKMGRYLNYLLENEALSASFPLNAVLTASQSGLECAKQILQDHVKQKKRRRTNQSLSTAIGNTSSAYAILSTLLAKNASSYFNTSDGDDAPWIRTAARAAMSLQFHGILETAGHESTSAKIQHASLPKFGVSSSNWDDDESDNAPGAQKLNHEERQSVEGDFEAGVISIESELLSAEGIGGYDLLPSPGPSEEHHVLNATNVRSVSGESRSRYVYGTSSASQKSPTIIYESHTADAVTLGTVKVDSDIDKLKGIIESVDRILKRLHHSSTVIEATQSTRNALQIDLLKDIDSFGDSRGGVISQRSLVNGVGALGNSYVSLEKGSRIISDDLGWQSSLARAAVGATDEVRDAVVASRTATRAKAASYTAAAKAKKAYECLTSSCSQDEINAAQSEAAASQSHAIHATVVEYESNVAKKRAAISLAQDVKCWNTYRKRELLQSCLEYARSQRDACGKAADAWESLRDGLIDSSTLSFTPEELVNILPEHTPIVHEEDILTSSATEVCRVLHESHTSIANEVVPTSSLLDSNREQILELENFPDEFLKKEDIESASESMQASSSGASLPEAFVDVTELTASAFELDESADNVYFLRPPDLFEVDNDHFAPQQDVLSAAESSAQSIDEATGTSAYQQYDLGIESELNERPFDEQYNTSVGVENMTMSMQSLIDGLMAWGGVEEPMNDMGYQADVMERGPIT
ncbi:hypothetical protein HJC23_008331 [Cyclotella cryptica]|uniref:PX domain-containing protein n=1 Tax=Cyclotella cryptica TaxID=29204 RepID=A0ABD3Q6P4_9STRA|eukprot:CCRYP_008599-RA/>CCRYP_008599-RA protein AED:0.01 eAED:0.01 QI:182/1/1/1/1/1/3/281/1323